MEIIDPEVERQKFREAYAQMTEDELRRVADDAYDLVPVAREALRSLIAERHLQIQLKAAPTSSGTPDDDHLAYLCPVWSEGEAELVTKILDQESIRWYLGPGNAQKIQDFEGNFNTGVDVKVPAADYDCAPAALQPDDEDDNEEAAPVGEDEGYEVSCPRCQSLQVDLETEPESNFDWRCIECGHRWKDDRLEWED